MTADRKMQCSFLDPEALHLGKDAENVGTCSQKIF